MNYFDQFDQSAGNKPTTAPVAAPRTQPESKNFFDQFDGLPTEAPKTPQMKLKDYIKNFIQDTVGTVETAASMGTGVIGTVVGDAMGGLQQLNNWVTPGDSANKTNPSDVRNTIQNALTYKPQTVGGERVSNAIAPAMDVLSYIPRQVGAAAEGLGASPYIRDLTTDVAGVVLPVAAAKGVRAAAPVATQAVEAARPVVSKAGNALMKGVDIGTNPQLHSGLAAYNAVTGNIPGALGHAGIVAGRTLVDKMRGVETPPITIKSVGAQLADAVIDKATTNPVLRKAAKGGVRAAVSEGIQKAATNGARVTTAVSPAEAIIAATTGEAVKTNRVRSRNPGSSPDVMSMADEGGYRPEALEGGDIFRKLADPEGYAKEQILKNPSQLIEELSNMPDTWDQIQLLKKKGFADDSEVMDAWKTKTPEGKLWSEIEKVSKELKTAPHSRAAAIFGDLEPEFGVTPIDIASQTALLNKLKGFKNLPADVQQAVGKHLLDAEAIRSGFDRAGNLRNSPWAVKKKDADGYTYIEIDRNKMIDDIIKDPSKGRDIPSF